MKREMFVLCLLGLIILCSTIVLTLIHRLTLSAPHPRSSHALSASTDGLPGCRLPVIS